VNKELSRGEIFQAILVVLIPIQIIWLGYDISLRRRIVARNKQYALDWESNEEAIFSGVKAALDQKPKSDNPFPDGKELYQRNHDLWERGWTTIDERFIRMPNLKDGKVL
jgi:hypothetical protein